MTIVAPHEEQQLEPYVAKELVPVGSARPGPVGTPPATTRGDIVRSAAIGLTLIAALVASYAAYLFVVTPLEHDRSQRGLEASFVQAVNFKEAWVGGQIPEEEPVARLDIAAIGVHEVVVEGTSGRNLQRGPGHLRASGLPGQAGNSVVAGRRMTYGSPFRHLDGLRKGDEIRAVTGLGKSTYVVESVRQVRAEQNDVLGPFGDDRLTLISSAPELRASRRLVVVAKLKGDPLPTLAVRPTTIRPDERGLHSDRSATLQLVLWLQALVAALLVTAWLRLRWRRWPTWLLATPVIVLLLVQVFDCLTPVLPSTL